MLVKYTLNIIKVVRYFRDFMQYNPSILSI